MLALASTTSPGLATLSASTSIVVALLALAMVVVAVRARLKRGNPALVIVAWAFVIFAVKNVFTGYNVLAHDVPAWPSVPHDQLELVLSLFDLAIMLLLVAPLVVRKRTAG